MKTYIDNDLIKYLIVTPEINFLDFQKTCYGNDLSTSKFSFSWHFLLEYLDFSDLFESLPIFDDQNRLYLAIIKTLETELDKDLIIEMYDKLFAECIRQIQTLAEINASYILQLIEEKQRSMRIPEHQLIGSQLNHYLETLVENPKNALHDLTLSLAWDRMCVYLAIILESQSQSSEAFLKNIQILKSCLIESFIHIDSQKKSKISFFRLMEAIFAYEMRPERLDTHSEEDWLLLSKCGKALRSRNIPVSIYYIDYALHKISEKIAKVDVKVFTMDSTDIINTSLLLADFVIRKLQMEGPFEYSLSATEIVKVMATEEGLFVNSILDTF
jgi:hypothetical protein